MAKKPTIRPALHKVVMFGRSGVGKTALTRRFMYNEFREDYYGCMTDDYFKEILLDGEKVQFDITHIDGQTDCAAISDSLFRRGEGFLCTFSITDDKSFQATEDFKEQLLRIKGDKNIPFLLVGNKCDLEESRKVTFQEASDRATKWGVPYVETSAGTTKHVDKVFLDLMREISARKMEENNTCNGEEKDKGIRKKLKWVTSIFNRKLRH